MAQLVVNRLLLVFVVLVGSTTAAVGQCVRPSPEEIWYSDFSPQLNTSLEEIRVYYRVIFSRLEDGNLFNFIPHIKNDQEQAANLTDAAMLAEETGLALVERAYEIVQRAWLELGESGLMFIEEDGSKLSRPDHLIHLMETLQSTYVKANKILTRSASTISNFYKYLVDLVLEGVTLTLEEELDTTPDTAELAKLLQDKIASIAPGDLVGNVVRRFIGRGLGTIRTKPAKETPNILHKMIERIDQLVAEFKKVVEDESLSVKSWTSFWQRALEDSIKVTTEREAQGKEDFDLIFRNEIYVTETLMNVMTSY